MKKNPKRVGPVKMRELRSEEWKKKQKIEDLKDENKIWKTEDMLPEQIQDFEKEMVM